MMKHKFKILFILIVAFLVYNLNTGSFFDLMKDKSGSGSLAEEEYDPYENVPRHTYDWRNLYDNNGRIEYTATKDFQPVYGMDVSVYQGDVDWPTVAVSGISFAMLRVGYRGYESGIINLDKKFAQNIQGASLSGIDVGVYFFSQAINEAEAVEEAQFVLDNINGYDLSFPIVYDLENIADADHRTHNLTQDERTAIALAFCDTVEKAGYKPMVYGNAAWLTDYYDLNEISEYDIWLAQYADEPTFPYEFRMWQYTDKGYVAGIDHAVDLNICFTPF